MMDTNTFLNIQKCSQISSSKHSKQITRDLDLLAYLSFSLCNSSISIKFLVIPTSSSKCISCFLPSQSQYFLFHSSILSSPLVLSCPVSCLLISLRLWLSAFLSSLSLSLSLPLLHLSTIYLYSFYSSIRNLHFLPSPFHPNLS